MSELIYKKKVDRYCCPFCGSAEATGYHQQCSLRMSFLVKKFQIYNEAVNPNESGRSIT